MRDCAAAPVAQLSSPSLRWSLPSEGWRLYPLVRRRRSVIPDRPCRGVEHEQLRPGIAVLLGRPLPYSCSVRRNSNRVIHSRRPPAAVDKVFAQLPIGDGWWQGKKSEQASRGYEYHSLTPRRYSRSVERSTVRASTAGCAGFPKRILRCRLGHTRLYYKAFAETKSCLRRARRTTKGN